MQEGTIGLVRAVERFDHRRGLKFFDLRGLVDPAFARRRGHRRADDPDPVRTASDRLSAVRRAEHELERSASGSPSTEAIAERTGLASAACRHCASGSVTASLDEPVGEEGSALGDLIADRRAVDPWRHADERETHRQLWSILGTLPDRHREVLLCRYGLRGEEPETHAEIGSRLGVGEGERSRQLEREALHRLRSLGDGRRLAA